MDTTNRWLTVLLVASVLVVSGFLYYANGITGLAAASVDSGFDYWPLIAGMSGILGIGAIVAGAHVEY